MIIISDPYTKAELVQSLESANREVADYFASIAAEAFFTRFGEAWSPAENLVHLIKSVSAVAKGMKLPKIFLLALFGTSKKSSRRFAQLTKDYRDKLAKGGRATGRYIPLVNAPVDFEQARQGILKKFDEVGKRLPAAASRWDEKSLDKFTLPHPLLGKLTVREMLFFTMYHNLHHLNNVRRQRGHEVITV